MRQILSALALWIAILPGATGAALAEEKHGKDAVGPRFVEFDPFSVSVIRRTHVAGFLSVAFNLLVEDEVTEQEVERLRAKLSDSVIRTLSRVASSRLDVSRPVDVDLIRAYLQFAIDGVIGAGKAQVLVETVSLQPG